MTMKITLIEYDEGVYAGDASEPDIQGVDYFATDLGGDSGQAKSELTEEQRIDSEVAVKLSGLHDYLFGISSSSSSSESSSSESSSSESSSSESSSSSSSSLSSSSSSSSESSSSSSSSS